MAYKYGRKEQDLVVKGDRYIRHVCTVQYSASTAHYTSSVPVACTIRRLYTVL